MRNRNLDSEGEASADAGRDGAAAQRPGRGLRRELMALFLLAGAVFATLSLVSNQVGGAANLCGPIGQSLARAALAAVGLGAYLVMGSLAGLGVAISRRVSPAAIGRGLIGAACLVLALDAATYFIAPARGIGGELGKAVGGWLYREGSVGGGWLAVVVGLLTGAALLLRRAPTELVAFRRWRRRSDVEPIRLEPAMEAAEPEGLEYSPPKIAYRADTIEEPDPPPLDPPARRIELVQSARPKPPPARGRAKSGFRLPPLSLLDHPPLEQARLDEAAMQRSAGVLEQKLADFGVEGRVVEVQPGPVVTMYKFEPASGVKVSQIVNLADDLSMALRAMAIRIQAPVPGEAVVGIEVPNRKRETIYLREILEVADFSQASSQLTIALGKDISGQPVVADLARMPHLLIAGATGSGKSVSIHTMLASILLNATADDVRFILIDPKMLELSAYEHIPHLLVPVVVDPEKAAAALLWATQEMENRYRQMRELAVRNIDGYNKAVEAGSKVIELKPRQAVNQEEDDEPGPKIQHRKLPKIVIVIDELADLLLTEGKVIERDITRLAQKARAAGIHLLLATQRPSVDVLTGLIKANLPARIALQVASRVDSRTILDSMGAERLLGAGDMLYMPPSSSALRRLHGPFVSESEIRKVTDFLRAQGVPDYRMEILDTHSGGGAEGEDGGERDEMYDEAVRIVLETNQASISMIQRRLRIGYNRAARMVEQMEREGLVAPPDGARPREVRNPRALS